MAPPLEGSTSPGAGVPEAGHPFRGLGRRTFWFLGNGPPRRPGGLGFPVFPPALGPHCVTLGQPPRSWDSSSEKTLIPVTRD